MSDMLCTFIWRDGWGIHECQRPLGHSKGQRHNCKCDTFAPSTPLTLDLFPAIAIADIPAGALVRVHRGTDGVMYAEVAEE